MSVWKHVQTQPKPNSTFHRLARQKGVVLCTLRHAYQDKCDLILGLLFELFRCLNPERMWGPNLLLPIYPHTEFIRWDGRQSSEMKEREFWCHNAALIFEVSNSAQPWRFYLCGPIHIFLKTNWTLICNLDKPEKYKVLMKLICTSLIWTQNSYNWKIVSAYICWWGVNQPLIILCLSSVHLENRRNNPI